MRKAKPKKRVILPDPVFNDQKVSKFVNHLMYDGKKSKSYEIFYNALETVKAKMQNEEKSALEIWKQALDNITPQVEVKSRRIGGATFQVPTEIRPDRKESVSMKNMISFARKRSGKSMADKLAAEIMDAFNNQWKGNNHKSGGVATNIGVHFYDMLQWIFGPVQENIVHVMSFDRVAGYLGLKRARVRYFLSINSECLPENAVQGEKKTYRTLNIDGDEFEFSAGFTELHTKSYKEILAGRGFRISEAIPCIQTVHDIRYAKPVGLVGDYHPLAKMPLAKHPFGWDDVQY